VIKKSPTTWGKLEDVLPRKLPSMLVYTAVIRCVPAVSALVVSVAVPTPLTVWGAPRGDAPSMNWTEPVGVAVLTAGPEVLAMVAVNVTACPKYNGFTDEVTVVEVDAGFTAWLRVPELPLKPPLVFVYTA